MVKKLLVFLLANFMVFSFIGFVVAGTPDDAVTTRNRYIKYIPQDHSLEMVRVKNLFTLNGVTGCSSDLIDKKTKCDGCKNIWGDANCPDCCFNTSTLNPILDCTPAVDSKYDCGTKVPFTNCRSQECMACISDRDCSVPEVSLAGSCQRLCCRVDLTLVDEYGCTKDDKTGNWLCKKELPINDPSQKNSMCTKNNNISNCFNDYPNPYTYKRKIEDPKDCPDNENECYEYKVSNNFKKCVLNCKSKADAWDQCQKNVFCCEQQRCPNASSQTCNVSDCAARLDQKNGLCNSLYNAENCNKWYEEYNKFSLGSTGEGELQNCFKEINSQATYQFVARGDEDIVITWQILVKNSNKDIDERFLSMVKVFDSQRLDAPIHESIVHQKSFSADFFINSATTIPRIKLKPGRTYVVKLYYYFPVQGFRKVAGNTVAVTLQVNVEDLQIIILRNRN